MQGSVRGQSGNRLVYLDGGKNERQRRLDRAVMGKTADDQPHSNHIRFRLSTPVDADRASGTSEPHAARSAAGGG